MRIAYTRGSGSYVTNDYESIQLVTDDDLDITFRVVQECTCMTSCGNCHSEDCGCCDCPSDCTCWGGYEEYDDCSDDGYGQHNDCECEVELEECEYPEDHTEDISPNEATGGKDTVSWIAQWSLRSVRFIYGSEDDASGIR